METIRLRTLTEKSKIGWGKYADATVQELLKINKGALAWLYYNVQWMTFTEKVLMQIPIFPEQRIAKPGIDPDAHNKRIWELNRWRYGDKVRLVVGSKRKRRARKNAQRVEDNTDFSKRELQAINHGHASVRIFK